MNRKRLFLSSIFLGATLIAPMAITANAAPQGISIRVYDRNHKDYHNWDDREERSYQTFRVEHPKYHVMAGRQDAASKTNTGHGATFILIMISFSRKPGHTPLTADLAVEVAAKHCPGSRCETWNTYFMRAIFPLGFNDCMERKGSEAD